MAGGHTLSNLMRETMLPRTAIDSSMVKALTPLNLQRRLLGALTCSQWLAGRVLHQRLLRCPPVRLSRLSGHQLPVLAPDPALGQQLPFSPLPCPCRDTRQAQWHADVAIRAASPPVETAVMARCEALLAGGRAAEALSEVRGLTLEGNPAATGVLRLRARALYLSGMVGWHQSQAGHNQCNSE